MNLKSLLTIGTARGATVLTAAAATPPPADLVNAFAQLALAVIGVLDIIAPLFRRGRAEP